jgi:hypothetical protein
MEAAGAAGAAEIEPADVNQQAASRLLTGLRISDSLSEENKNKLRKTGLQREELARILAVLEQIKEQPKQGADPCIGSGPYGRVLIEGISGQLDALAVGEALRVVDDFYEPSEFNNTSTIRPPLARLADGGHLVWDGDSHGSARVSDFTVTDKLLAVLRREEGTHIPAVMESWHLRPDFRSMDDRCAKFSRTPAVNLLLNVADAAGLDHRAVEKMLFDGLKAGLAGVSLGEQLAAVEISRIKWLKSEPGNPERRSSPYAAHYSNSEVPIRVYFKTPQDRSNLMAHAPTIKLQIAADITQLSPYITLAPIRSREEYAASGDKLVKKAVEVTQAKASQDQEVIVITAQLSATFSDQHKAKKLPRLNGAETGRAIIEAMRGDMFGVEAAIVESDHQGARLDRPIHLVLLEDTEAAGMATNFAKRVVAILKQQGEQKLLGNVFSEIRLKKGTDVVVKTMNIQDSMEIAEDELSLNDVMNYLYDHLWSQGSTYLPTLRKDGGQVVFRGTVTSLDQIVESPESFTTAMPGAVTIMDIRKIFPARVSAQTLFAALDEMRGLQEIVLMEGDEQEKVGCGYVEICHPRRSRSRPEASGEK